MFTSPFLQQPLRKKKLCHNLKNKNQKKERKKKKIMFPDNKIYDWPIIIKSKSTLLLVKNTTQPCSIPVP